MHSVDTRQALCVALEAALEAGDYFKSRFQTELVVKTKSSPSDLVTDVDPHCEKLIREHIQKHFPEHLILGEESVDPGHDASVAATEAVCEENAVWIVDPLDGTTNFVNAIPLSVVSIALAIQGKIELGVIYDPYRQEVFYAHRGQGVYLADRQDTAEWLRDGQGKYPGMALEMSDVSELHLAVVATGLPMRHANRQSMMERTTNIICEAKSVRALGAAALHLAYVAAGRIDLFWEYELNAWDMAAGILLVEEAGGHVRALDGSEYTLMTRDVIVTKTKELSDKIRSMLEG